MECYDQYGVRFMVFAKDPASLFVNRLKAKGYRLVVLPRTTYIQGALAEPIEASSYVHTVRMADCLKELQG